MGLDLEGVVLSIAFANSLVLVLVKHWDLSPVKGKKIDISRNNKAWNVNVCSRLEDGSNWQLQH